MFGSCRKTRDTRMRKLFDLMTAWFYWGFMAVCIGVLVYKLGEIFYLVVMK